MDVIELAERVNDFSYILAKISKYLKNNQYVYLRAFDSWKDSYNQTAACINADKSMSVPVFRLSPIDYSVTGKSIKLECVEKFVRTINHQIDRLEDKITAMNKAVEEELARKHPLDKFFHRDDNDTPVEPPAAVNRVFVAIPAGESELKIFWQGIQPALETQGLSFFRTDRPQLDDDALCEICQELHSCRLAIFNLSGQAPNVMLSLGLAYGIGKPVIILQQQNEVTFGKIVNDGYISFASAADLKSTLSAALLRALKH